MLFLLTDTKFGLNIFCIGIIFYDYGCVFYSFIVPQRFKFYIHTLFNYNATIGIIYLFSLKLFFRQSITIPRCKKNSRAKGGGFEAGSNFLTRK